MSIYLLSQKCLLAILCSKLIYFFQEWVAMWHKTTQVTSAPFRAASTRLTTATAEGTTTTTTQVREYSHYMTQQGDIVV